MKPFLDLYYRILKLSMTLLMAFILVPVSIQIASRHIDVIPRYIWTEELARFCFVWIVMLGSIVAVRDGTHFDVDLMPHPKTKPEEGTGRLIVHVAMLLLAFVFAWYGYEFADFGRKQTSEMSGINMLSIYISFPLAGFSWILFLLEKISLDVELIRSQPSESNL